MSETGYARLTPGTPVTAGAEGTWTLRYEPGPRGVDEAGALEILWPGGAEVGQSALCRPSCLGGLMSTLLLRDARLPGDDRPPRRAGS